MSFNKIMGLMVEADELSGRIGHLSCIEYAEEYNELDRMVTKIMDELTELLGTHHDAVKVEELISEVITEYGEKAADMEISVLTGDEFIEQYVLQNADEETKEMFVSLFYFMSGDSRRHWLEVEHLNDEGIYYDRLHEYVVIAT